MISTGKIICIDPGHGLGLDDNYRRPLMNCKGKRAFAVQNSMQPHPNDNQPGFYREDHGTLAIAKCVVTELEHKGHIVYLTRKDKMSALINLSSQSNNTWKKKHWKAWKWVKDFTNKKNADIFIALHTNASRGTGVAAFWANPIQGMELCNSIAGEINDQLGLRIHSIRKKRYLKLRNTCNGRACFLECLFHDNIDDIKLLLTSEGIGKMGKAIADGIDKYSKTF